MSHRNPLTIIKQKIKSFEEEYITLEHIIESFGEFGFSFMLIFFAIPMLFPVLPPGVSAFCGVPMIFFAIQKLQGKEKPTLPKKFLAKKIKTKHLLIFISKVAPIFNFLEKFLKARLVFLTKGIFEKIVFVAILILAAISSTPAPFAHTIPSFGVILVMLGFITHDGIMVILGLITGIIGVFIASMVLVFGVEIIDKLIKMMNLG